MQNLFKSQPLPVLDLTNIAWPELKLWSCGGTWCDHSMRPYILCDGKVFDSSSGEMILYPDVIHIPEEIFHSGIILAVASRTGER